MPENIFEHTTSIAGLTCKPLDILSETISTQEMSMARGGDDGDDSDYHNDSDGVNILTQIEEFLQTKIMSVWEIITENPNQAPQSDFLGTGGVPLTEVMEVGYAETRTEENDNTDRYELNEDDYYVDPYDVHDDDENCEYCDDENCDGDCGHDDDDENGSGLDGMEGDFDLSENEMFT